MPSPSFPSSAYLHWIEVLPRDIPCQQFPKYDPIRKDVCCLPTKPLTPQNLQFICTCRAECQVRGSQEVQG